MPKTIDIEITEHAESILDEFLASINDYEPTLCFLKGTEDDEEIPRWTYGAYGPDNIEVLQPEYSRRGFNLLYQVEKYIVALPQPEYLDDLVGKTVDVIGAKLVILER